MNIEKKAIGQVKSFLIGMMCAIALISTVGLWVPVAELVMVCKVIGLIMWIFVVVMFLGLTIRLNELANESLEDKKE